MSWSGLRRLLLAAGAGFAMWAAFPDLSWWWLIVPSLAVLFALVDHASTGRALAAAFVFGACWWLPLTDWVVLATGGRLPWFALAATQICWLLAWVLIVRLASVWAWARAWWGQILVYVLSWVGVEQARGHFPWSGFPWGNVAIPQVDSPLGRLAPFGGEVLVSVVVVTLAVLVRRAFSLRTDEDVKHWWTRPLLVLLALALVIGSALAPLAASQEAGSLRVGVVQGNIELPGPRTFAIEGKVTANHAAVSRELAEHAEAPVDLAIWGETAADRDPRESSIVSGSLDSAARILDAPILFGFANMKDGYRWNWLGVWYRGAGLDEGELYAKQKPVPFGEFIPFRSFISALATEAAQVNIDMAAADNPALMHVELADSRTIPVAVGICFESAYSSVIGQGVREGGQLIVAPSNNYHFRTSAESAQQAQLLRFRALEFSRSAIQASTTGESVVIRPNGAIQAKTGRQSAEYLIESLPLRTALTPSARMGEWPALIIMSACGLFTLLSLVALIGRALLTRFRKRPGAQASRASASRRGTGEPPRRGPGVRDEGE